MRTVIFSLMLVVSMSAGAQRIRATSDLTFHVNPAGNNALDCRTPATACQTMQATWEKILADYDMAGKYVFMQLADGVYTSGLNIVDQPVGIHSLQIIGNCGGTPYAQNRANVVIAPPAGTAAFWAQDTAILVVSCLRIQGPNSTGFQGRQHVIIDANWIDFGPLSAAVAVTQHSIVNFGGEHWITGDMTAFAYATLLSIIGIQSPVVIKQPVNIKYFLLSYTGSVITLDAPNGRFVNGSYVTGQQSRVWRKGVIETFGAQIPGTESGWGDD